ncbi:MAG: hypothetical protein AAFV33_10425 [Chloroflexota bacterium]
MQNNQHKLSFFHTAARLQAMLETLDEVHTAASDNALDVPSGIGKAELIAMLREINYLAAEAANELEQGSEQPRFRVIKGGRWGQSSSDRSRDDYPHEAIERRGFDVLVTDTPTPLTVMKRAGTRG